MSRTNSNRINLGSEVSPFVALDRALTNAKQAPTHSEGWRSLIELADELQLSLSTAEKRVRRWREAGLIETWSGYVVNRFGIGACAARYRVKPAIPHAATKTRAGQKTQPRLRRPSSGVRFAASCLRQSERSLSALRPTLKARAARAGAFEPLDFRSP